MYKLPEELVSKNRIIPLIIVENIRSWSLCEALTQSVVKGKTRTWVRRMQRKMITPWIIMYCAVVKGPT